MIVPQSRLLFWFAVVVLPFSVLGALYAEAMIFCVVLMAGLLALALVDAVLALGRLEGISVELPKLVRFSRERPGSFALTLHHERKTALRLRIGLPLPPELPSSSEELLVVLPAGSAQSRLDWPCQPARRGNYRLQRVHLETTSRLGFWAVRGAVPVECEVRVYPNLHEERRHLAALFLNRGAFGLHAQRQVGKGRDFEKLREYIPGDSYDEIHWKATARHGHPITKVFQIERTQEVYVIIDASRLSARPVVGESLDAPAQTTLERFLTAALILGQAAEQQGDLFGLLVFSDRVETFLRARNGKAHYSACRDAIHTLEAKPVTPDFDEISAFLRTRLRRRALLVFLTSLDDPVLAESFLNNMTLLAGQHLVLVNMIQPPEARPLFTNDAVAEVDDLYRHLGGHLRWHSLRDLGKTLQRRGVRFSLLENEKLAGELVSQYLGVKQRQLI